MIRNRPCSLLTLGVLTMTVLASAIPSSAEEPIDPERIKAIASMLPEAPTGLGRPCTDRESWSALGGIGTEILSRAEGLLTSPFPDSPDELFLDFSKTGNRTHWQDVASNRRGRVTVLTLAECLEDKGRFVKPLEEVIARLCEERTWVMPAHDRGLANFNGERVDIDLGSCALAWNLATADWLLQDKLLPATRQRLRDEVRRRILDPYLAMVRFEREPNWWMLTTNNWNAVCLAGVTGAGLALADSRDERALFVAAADRYSLNFLKGFTQDGYCSEGVGYWDYGFGNYVLLAETILQATGGGVNLFARPEAQAPATYGWKIQILNGVCPAFADCSLKARPSAQIMGFVNCVDRLGYPDKAPSPSLGGSLFDAMIYAFPNSATRSPVPEGTASPGPRSWFDQAGILISRPGNSGARMGVALKGGHNDEHHNHNDVGSFVVVLGERPVLTDPGSEVYTARTFSSKRYESNVLNSFGHPVPVVAGKLQRTGRKAQGKVLGTEFNDEQDLLRLDIASAYDVQELEVLERTFVYSRKGAGSLKVEDEVRFSSPQRFATALVTMGEWKRVQDLEYIATDQDQAVRVLIEPKGGSVTAKIEEIHEDCHGVPKRLGIEFIEPVSEASLIVRIEPSQ